MPPHFPIGKKAWVKIDLDDTLASYDGYKGWEHIGEPRPFAQAFVRLFKRHNWGVIVETGRPEAGLIWQWLEQWEFTFQGEVAVDYVNQSPLNLEMRAATPKLIADLSIDNANWPFCGAPVPLKEVARDLLRRKILTGEGMARTTSTQRVKDTNHT